MQLKRNMLLTDGDFNFNLTETDSLVEFREKKRESGVTLTAIGFGMSSNDEMMEAVSNAGNGVYTVLANKNHADEYVNNELIGGIMFHVEIVLTSLNVHDCNRIHNIQKISSFCVEVPPEGFDIIGQK